MVVNGESSQPALLISRVPQGSVFGPLLFLIYINDLSEINICHGAKITLYADDVLLYRTITSPEDFVTLQEDIKKVGNWSSTNFLTLNRAKCKFVTISHRRAVSTPPTSLLLQPPTGQTWNIQIPWCSFVTWLLLGWTCPSMCAKAKKILGLLYRQFYNHTPGNAMLQLYLSLVRPHLDYAASIWSPHMKKDKTLLENVHKFALCMATRSWDSSYQDPFEMTTSCTCTPVRHADIWLCDVAKCLTFWQCSFCFQNGSKFLNVSVATTTTTTTKHSSLAILSMV